MRYAESYTAFLNYCSSRLKRTVEELVLSLEIME